MTKFIHAENLDRRHLNPKERTAYAAQLVVNGASGAWREDRRRLRDVDTTRSSQASGVPSGTPAPKRIGRDGKRYPATTKKTKTPAAGGKANRTIQLGQIGDKLMNARTQLDRFVQKELGDRPLSPATRETAARAADCARAIAAAFDALAAEQWPANCTLPSTRSWDGKPGDVSGWPELTVAVRGTTFAALGAPARPRPGRPRVRASRGARGRTCGARRERHLQDRGRGVRRRDVRGAAAARLRRRGLRVTDGRPPWSSASRTAGPTRSPHRSASRARGCTTPASPRELRHDPLREGAPGHPPGARARARQALSQVGRIAM